MQFTETADDDLAELFEYIASEGGDAIARTFVQSIIARCRRLADLPGMLGTMRPDLAPGLRSTPHRGYVSYIFGILTTRSKSSLFWMLVATRSPISETKIP